MKINILVGARFNAGLVASELAKIKGYDVTVYTSSPAKNWQHSLAGQEFNVKFVPLPLKIISRLLKFKLSRKLRELDVITFDKLSSWVMRDCDVLHGWATFSLISAKKQLAREQKFILDRACPHVLFQEELLTTEAEYLDIKYSKTNPYFIERIIEEYEVADKIVIPSNYTYQTFVNNGIPKEKLQIVRLDANFNFELGDISRKKSNSNQFVVGTLGGNVLRKGFIYLIRAWKKLKLKNAKLLIKTSLVELQQVPIVWDLVKEDETIEVVGYVKDITVFYKQCDVFCLPSIDDGFGMVVLEAMAFGIPVIATKNVGASEMIEDGKTGYVVENRDVTSISKYIELLYRDTDLRDNIGVNALISYKEYKESKNGYGCQLKKLYSEL